MADEPFVAHVLEQCDALKEARVWLGRNRAAAWLNNFEDDERLTAAALLDHFVFYTSELTEKLFFGAFESLANSFFGQSFAPADAAKGVDEFLRKCRFTRVAGERPNPTDSGNAMCRVARQILGPEIEDHVVEPAQALDFAVQGHPIVLLDDVVGTGDQVLSTWHNDFGKKRSLARIYEEFGLDALLVCVASTKKGAERIVAETPLELHAAHLLGSEYLFSGFRYPPQLPPDIGARADALLRKYAPQLAPQLPEYMQTDEAPVYGFGSLGLALGFEHGTPDWTLPIFWGRAHSRWTPLVEKR